MFCSPAARFSLDYAHFDISVQKAKEAKSCAGMRFLCVLKEWQKCYFTVGLWLGRCRKIRGESGFLPHKCFDMRLV